MKKIIVAAILLIAVSNANAQEKKEKEKEKKNFSPSYAVKWNPAGLAFGKIGLFGEYNYKRKKSITFGIGIPSEKKHTFELDGEDRDIFMKTFSIMGGYRMYLGKKTMTGFYFEPYLKYVKNDASFSFTDPNFNNKPVTFNTTSSYSAIGVGAQLGVQFMIAKRVVFDFFLLGPEANSAKHNVVMKDVSSTLPWSAQDAAKAQTEIDDNIGDVPIIGDHLKVKVDANARTVSSEYKGFLPGFRGGLTIGVRF
jgi:hypothetical protein